MERSWLQRQASLSKFDGYRDSQPFSKVKVTAAPAPAACSTAPEAGRTGDVVYDPHNTSADWSGFAPRNCVGRRMYDGGPPAAHKETIVRSEEHGIVPADDAVTEDSLKTRRRVISEPARAGGGLVLGGPEAPEPEERFKTVARAANARESTPLEMKSEGCRHLKHVGKKHITPPYERERGRVGGSSSSSSRSSSISTGRQAPRGDAGARNTNLWARAPLGDPLLQGATGNGRDPFGSRGRVAATSGPGSFLQGLGRQVAGSGAVGGVVWSPCRGEHDDGVALGDRREEGPRRKELYLENYNPYTSGYTGHQPRR
eukprot:g7844.t1